MSTPTKLISYEDSLFLPENRFEEIIRGESRIMPPATMNHGFVIRALSMILGRQLDETEYYIMSEGTGLVIERDPLTYRVPDLAVFRVEALSDALQGVSPLPYIWAVPDLVVECLSPSNRRGLIRELLANYAQIAVPEVWLLEPQPPRFTSYYYESGALREHQSAARAIVTPRLLPGVTVDLSDLWTAFEHGPFGVKR